jgi:hypothetical protein
MTSRIKVYDSEGTELEIDKSKLDKFLGLGYKTEIKPKPKKAAAIKVMAASNQPD